MNELTTTRTAEVVAAEIRALTASMLSNVIEIGRRMCEVKEMLPYGEFGRWIEDNTGYSSSTANNFMRLFQEYGAAQGSLFGAQVECQTIGKLSYTKALALLALPAEERESFAEEHHVEEMSTRELKQAIRERDEALRRAEEAEQAGEGAALAMGELQDKLAEANTRIKNLQRAEADALQKYQEADATADSLMEELDALKSRPVEVAVQVDEKAVERARQEAASAAQESHMRAMAEADRKLKAVNRELQQAKQAQKDRQADLEQAVRARQDAEQQAEDLRRQLADAGKKDKVSGNADLVEFNIYFKAAQGELEKMGAVLKRLDDADQAELAGKLRKAVAALGGMAEKLAGGKEA